MNSMFRRPKHVLASLGCLLTGTLLWACGESREAENPPETTTKTLFDPMAMELTDPALVKGREIWVGTCGDCHIKGLGGAPKIGDKTAWEPRIAKGMDTLYDHAIHGFMGPQLNEMPPKGDNEELTDHQIRLAVDFVVHASH